MKIAYSTVKYGSSGSDVYELQRKLNKKGYNLSVDGKFGAKTQSAVRDYQKKNGLAVDGIVGKNTWSSLNKTPTNANSKNNSTANNKSNKGNSSSGSSQVALSKPVYKKSNQVKNTEEKLKLWEDNPHTEYKSKYSDEIESILSDILNRKDFTYNLNADPLYEQYRSMYMKNGEKAMMDAVAEASSLSGGYSNSYALTAGNQAYGEYLGKLNEVGLDLRDRAYDVYKDEGEKLIDDISLLRSLDGDDYNRYLDELERYYKDGDYLLKRLTSMSDTEYERFLTSLDSWENDRAYAFKQSEAQREKEEFAEKMAFEKSEAERNQKNKDREYNLALRKASSKSSSASTSSKKTNSKSDPKDAIKYPKSYKEFVMCTGYGGILTETEFNEHTEVVKKYSNYQKYLKAMYIKYCT